jgi:hypothetical protein
MKKINFFFLVSIMLLASCDRNASCGLFFLENKSDYEIRLEIPNFFYNSGLQKDTTITLNKNATICYYEGCMGWNDRPLANASDITIHFNDTLSVRYYREHLLQENSSLAVSQYNPLLKENYSLVHEGNTYKYTYTFTNKDYENAEVINKTIQ